jgi:uncharacterized protein YegJ (DUF2314 family)
VAAPVAAADGGLAAPGAAVPAGALLAPDGFSYAFVVYAAARPREDPRATLARLLAGGPLTLGAGLPPAKSAAPAVWLRRPSLGDLPLPSSPSTRHLSPGERRAFAGYRDQTLLAFRGPAAQALPAYRHALAIARGLAEAARGVAYDVETNELFLLDAWTARARAFGDGFPDVVSHILVQSSADEEAELGRLNTVGMAKLALPDVVVSGVTSSDVSSMGGLVNLVCQTLVEGGRVAPGGRLALSTDAIKEASFRQRETSDLLRGAERAAVVDLVRARRRDDDPDNQLIEIVFPGPAAEVQIRQDALLSRLYGAEDQVRTLDHDAAMLAVSRRAKQAVLALKPRYRRRPPFQEKLLVKAPFRMDHGKTGNEWMWVEVVRWQGKTIHGVLQNDPVYVSGLKAGARVEVDESSLFDYQLTRADGSVEGNQTGKLMDRAQ